MSTIDGIQPTKPEDVDLNSRAVQESPWDTYTFLRTHDRFHEVPVEGMDMMVVSRFEDLYEVLRNTTDFGRGAYVGADPTDPAEADKIMTMGGNIGTPMVHEPPLHRKYRNISDPWFSVANATEKRPMIEKMANDLVDGWIDQGEIELVSAYAMPLPVQVITQFMGFPKEHIPQLKEWSEACVLQFEGGVSPERQAEANRKVADFDKYILETIADRRKNPDEWVITGLLGETWNDTRPMTDVEIAGTVKHHYFGGNETTTFAITSGMYLLLSQPDVYERLQQDRSLIPQFVEEVLRVESPTQGLPRIAKNDTEINGCPVKKGTVVHMLYGSANQDEDMFPNARKVDLDRKNAARHLAFSIGETHCPGAGLSRTEQRITWETFLDRLANMRFTPAKNDFTHAPNYTMRAFKELHVSFDKA